MRLLFLAFIPFALLSQDLDLNSFEDIKGPLFPRTEYSDQVGVADIRDKFGSVHFDQYHLNDALYKLRQNIPFNLVSFVSANVLVDGEHKVAEWHLILEDAASKYGLNLFLDSDSGTIFIFQNDEGVHLDEPFELAVSAAPSVNWSRATILEVLRERAVRLTPRKDQRYPSNYAPFLLRSTPSQ